MKIQIITVGKKNPSELDSLIRTYEKRLKASHVIDWLPLKPSSLKNDQARSAESNRILNIVPKNTVVWLLDERGQQLNNQQLAGKLKEVNVAQAKDLTIIIGGAYGVSKELRNKADFVWSLSKLIFPHQLVRLILIEQLYRSTAINQGSAYHHQ